MMGVIMALAGLLSGLGCVGGVLFFVTLCRVVLTRRGRLFLRHALEMLDAEDRC